MDDRKEITGKVITGDGEFPVNLAVMESIVNAPSSGYQMSALLYLRHTHGWATVQQDTMTVEERSDGLMWVMCYAPTTALIVGPNPVDGRWSIYDESVEDGPAELRAVVEID